MHWYNFLFFLFIVFTLDGFELAESANKPPKMQQDEHHVPRIKSKPSKAAPVLKEKEAQKMQSK